ncbi:MAG: polymer-forming cytoskeletal protein [Burkholderiaceae bacterium]
MALASPFFGKRDPEPATPATPLYTSGGLRGTASTTKTDTPSNGQAISTAKTNNGLSNDAAVAVTPAQEGGSRLIVGPNIKLKGVEITDCDTLVVEGTVEATMDSRVIQIAATGAFKGSADIDIAEIHGQFEGNLTVRHKLVIYAQGKVSGTIRYGKVVIEEGGQLSGDVQFGTAPSLGKPTAVLSTAGSQSNKAGIQVAA